MYAYTDPVAWHNGVPIYCIIDDDGVVIAYTRDNNQ